MRRVKLLDGNGYLGVRVANLVALVEHHVVPVSRMKDLQTRHRVERGGGTRWGGGWMWRGKIS